jgi:hypothetical protein
VNVTAGLRAAASARERKGVTKAAMSDLICACLNSEVGMMAVEGHIRELADKHQKLQEQIDAEMAHSGWDELRIAALKKEKLRLKDELERLRAQEH